jgi:cytochrome c oxidase subunit II
VLLDAADEDVECTLDADRQFDLTPAFHGLYDATRVRRTVFAFVFASVVALTAVASAYAGGGGFLPPTPHSPNAHRIQHDFIFVSIFCGIIFLIVEGVLVAFIVKYRRGKRPRTAEGPQIHGSTRLEVLWTVAPVFLLAAIGVFIFWELPGIADAPKASAADSTTIQIEGHQYYWLFRYPNGAISIDRMIAPANQVVHEEVIGLDFDVNHSWWIPDLGGKYDAIPGKVNKTWFKAPVGTYVARCSELCGLQHALMTAEVDVVPRAEYDKFISTRASSAGVAALGKEEFTGVCEKCHRLDHVYVGPALGGNSLLANRKGIESLLRNGEGQMPAVAKNWTSAQIDALISYTKQFATASSG